MNLCVQGRSDSTHQFHFSQTEKVDAARPIAVAVIVMVLG